MSHTIRARSVWVVRHGDGFIVKVDRRALPHRKGATQSSAIRYARSLAKSLGCELVVQNMNGRIRIKDSHGRDPFPPKG